MLTRIALLCFVIVPLAFPCNALALCKVFYEFVGVDRIHLMVEGRSEITSGTDAGRTSGLHLYHQKPDGTKTLIPTSAVDTSGLWYFDQNIRLADLQPGSTQTLILYELLNPADGGEPTEHEINRVSVPVPQTPTLGGYMLFDETIENIQGLVIDRSPYPGSSDNFFPGGLTPSVPSGIHLELLNITEGECPESPPSFDGEGTVTIRNSTFNCPHGFGGSSATVIIADSLFNAGGYLSGSDVTVTGSHFPISSSLSGTNLSVSDSFFSGSSLGGALNITNCLFIGNTELSPTGLSMIQDCEFHPLSMSDYLTLNQATNFTGNVVAMQTKLSWTPGSPSSFTNNSFLTPEPFRIDTNNRGEPLDVSGNYWGASFGQSGGWLDGRRPLLDEGVIASHPHTSGPFQVCDLTDLRPVPRVFLDDIAFGQNSFAPYNYRNPIVNRDTMVSVLPRATAESLPGVRIRAYLDDVEISRVNDYEIKGDPGLPSTVSDNGDYTANFRIPAETVTPGNHILKITADTTGLSGYQGEGEINEAYRSIVFDAPYARGLRIGVMSINLKLGGFSPFPEKGSAAKVVARLKRDIPAMWPIRSQDLTVDNIGGFTYDGGFFGSFFPGLTTAGFTNNLSWTLNAYLNEFNAKALVNYDFLVAVLPHGALGTAEGVNQGLRRRVAMIDCKSPGAAIHELGHALGLYRGLPSSEEYNLPSGENNGEILVNGYGIVVRKMTGFNPENRFTEAVPGGFHHFGNISGTTRAWDIMGAAEPLWICPSSLRGVAEGLREVLGTASTTSTVTTSVATSKEVQKLSDATTATKRILVHGILQLGTNMYGVNSWRIQPGSASAEDITLTDIDPITPFYNMDYEFIALDANDIATRTIWCTQPYSDTEGGPWSETFDVPNDTVRIQVRERYDHTVILDLTTGPGLTTVLLGPPSGPVAGPLQFSWTASPGLGGNDLLHHQLQVSADNGVTWRDVGPITTASSLTVPEEDLPAGSLTFRLVTSDGVSSATSMLSSSYSSTASEPNLTIDSPQVGDRAAPGTLWRLAVEATNFDADTTFSWTSSLDGILGNEALLEGVTLSPGAHIITCTVTDGSGHEASTTVNITVGDMPNVNLSLPEDALKVTTKGVDPALGNGAGFRSGHMASLTLTARNQGINGTAVLALYLSEDDGQETLLGSTDLSWGPFGTAELHLEYLPTGSGKVTVRGVITATDPSDPDISNNSRIWTFTNAPPEAHDHLLTLGIGTTANCILNGWDPNGDTLTYTLISLPTKGTLSGTPPDLIYTPTPNSSGWDSFNFVVNDGQNESPPATVRLYITPDGNGIAVHQVDAIAGFGGTITPPGLFPAVHGEKIPFVLMPFRCQTLDHLLVNDQEADNTLNYLLKVTSDETVQAIFRFENEGCSVNLEDAVSYLKILTGGNILLPNSNKPAIDINGDGKIGLGEVIYVLKQCSQ